MVQKSTTQHFSGEKCLFRRSVCVKKNTIFPIICPIISAVAAFYAANFQPPPSSSRAENYSKKLLSFSTHCVFNW